MGSEILDSSGGARPVAPEQALAGPAKSTPRLELDELTPAIQPAQPTHPSGVRSVWRRLRPDVGRRATFRTVIICLVVMALTASVVEFHSSRLAEAERNGRVAIDIRVVGIRPADGAASSRAEGSAVTADIRVHNLGPADVKLTALDVANGGDPSDVVMANDLTNTSTPIEPGVSLETAYTLRLPCRPSFQLGIGPPQLVARIRTADDAVHSVPVNLDAVNEGGGLLTGCVLAVGRESDAEVQFELVLDGSEVMGIYVPTGPRPVILVAPDVGVPVHYLTAPRLPTEVRPGEALVLRVTPTVNSCPPTALNILALKNLGISVGTQHFPDANLSDLVVRAADRACAQRR